MTSTTWRSAPLPRFDHAKVVVGPPGDGPGYWAGAPSALLVDGVFYLAYRLRRPVGQGRGFATVVARSHDGERFEPLAMVPKDAFGAESLERAAAEPPDRSLHAGTQIRLEGNSI